MANPTELNLNSTTPTPPTGKQPVLWQVDSAYTDPNTGLPLRDAIAYPQPASSSLEGTIKLAQDIGGTADLPKVEGIQGVGVVATSPTNGQVLQYDSGSGLYKPVTLTGAGGASGPTPAGRRWAYGSSSQASLTSNGGSVGDAPSATGSTSFQGASSGTFPTPLSTYTSSSNGAQIGLDSGGVSASTGWTVVGKNMLFITRFALSAITNVRLRVGVAAIGGFSSWLASDSLTSAAYAAFRFSTGASDTNFMCETGDTTAVTTTNSGVALAANTLYDLQIQFNDSVPNVVFSINNSIVVTQTTHLPPSGTALSFLTAAELLAAAAHTLYVAWFYEEADN